MKLTAEEALIRLQEKKTKLSGKKGVKNRSLAQLVRTIKKDSEDMLFAFKDGDVVTVTPADDVLPAVLGEFDTSGEEVVICQPALEWLTSLAAEVKWNLENDYPGYDLSEESQGNTGNMDTSETIGPLLGGIAWHQKMPYNNLNSYKAVVYPEGEEEGVTRTCVVGCVATAICQILLCLYRNGYNTGCLATPRYISSECSGYRFEVPVDPSISKFDFDNMLDSYSHYVLAKVDGKEVLLVVLDTYTEEQANAAARLCMHIGRAGKMMYGPTGSAMFTKDAKNILEKGVGIKSSYYGPKDILDNNDLTRIKESLRNNIPVIMSGGGHCFVCDGYRSDDDTYHFNWGYGPNRTNGWYSLTTFKYVDYDNPQWKKYTKSILNYVKLRQYIIINPSTSPQNNIRSYDLNGDGLINMSDETLAIELLLAFKVNTQLNSLYRRNGYNIRPVRRSIPLSNEHEYVDLGLPSGTLWATCNIGASAPWVYGDFISWGETQGDKLKYDWADYTQCDGTASSCHNIGQNISNTEYDAAIALWGDGWQMPTPEDWQELIDICKFRLRLEPSTEGTAYNYVEVSRRLSREEIAEYHALGLEPPTLILPLSGLKWATIYELINQKARYWTCMRDSKTSSKAVALELSFTAPTDAEIADLNYDGVIDATDLQMIIDRILGR